MNCADLELLICDYVDGTLPPASRRLVENHLEGCPACAALARDALAGLAFARQADLPEPPPELLTRILFEIPTRLEHPRPSRGLSRWLAAHLHPLLQPRFAMGMAMTILSFSILARFAGIAPRQLTPSDLHPARVWQSLEDRAHRTWERARKFYQSLRVVYELQTQLREWSELRQEEEARRTQTRSAGPPEAGESQPPESESVPARPGPAQPGQPAGRDGH